MERRIGKGAGADASGRLERNRRELAAWNQFYQRCAILRCDEAERDLLGGIVYAGFLRRVGAYRPGLVPRYDAPGSSDRERIDFLAFFDEAIERRPAPRGNADEVADSLGRKAYKDAIWFRAGRQPGEELKAIRGGLTGPAGLLNDATVQYLRNESMEVDFTEGTARSRSRPKFVDARAARSENGTAGEDREGDAEVWEAEASTPLGVDPSSIDGWVRPPSLRDDERASLRETIRRTFDARELAILYAFQHGISLSDKTLCDCCGLGKSRVSVLFKEEIPDKVRRLAETPGLPIDFDTSFAMGELFRTAAAVLGDDPAFAPLLALPGDSE